MSPVHTPPYGTLSYGVAFEHPEVERVAVLLDRRLTLPDISDAEARRLRRHRAEMVWVETVLFNGGWPARVPPTEMRPTGRLEALRNCPSVLLAAASLLRTIEEWLSGASPDV